MAKVVMHLMSLIVFLLLGVLMGAENDGVLSKTPNELTSGDVKEQSVQSNPKTLTNESPSDGVLKNGPEVALLGAIASNDIKPDEPGANVIDPKLTKVIEKIPENLNYVKSENPEVPENATEFLAPVETEGMPVLGADNFVDQVSIPQVQKEKSTTSKVKEMEEDADSKRRVGNLDSDHFTTGKHLTPKSEVTTDQHSTTELKIEAAKTIISKARPTKASSGPIAVKIPTEGKGKSGLSKPPQVEKSIKEVPTKEKCRQVDGEMDKFQMSQSNSVFRNINDSLGYFILNLLMMVMFI